MLKRPTSRRKSHNEQIEINLIPILDTMVTLIGFLLLTTSFLSVVSIESPLPQSNPTEMAAKLDEKPLQLTLTLREKDAELSSPFGKIDEKTIPNTKDNLPDIKAIHEALLEIKKKFPKESSIVIMPEATTAYDSLINLMDSFRTIEASDPPIFVKNEKTGNDEPAKSLFPTVIFGNILGDT